MAVGLVRYYWRTDDGMPHWALPDRVTSAIDLRPLSILPDTNSIGYAVAVIDGPLPDGSVELETGNETRDRDAWGSTLGYRPEGNNVAELTRSQLLDGADDTGDAAVRPLRGPREKVELWLGGRHEFDVSYTERLRQQVYTRNDLEKLMDDVEAGRLPLVMVRKALRAYADQHGISPDTLKRKTARWRGVTAERPETAINDSFHPDSFIFLNAYTPSGASGAWTTAGGSASHWQTGESRGVFEASFTSGSECFAWHPTAVSVSDNQCILYDVPGQDYGPFGPMCRGNGSTSGYRADNWFSRHRLWSFVSGVATSLGDVAATSQSLHQLRVRAISSAIKGSDVSGSWRIEATNTANTVGLRVGMSGYSTGGSSQYRIAQSLEGRDFLTLSVTGVAPSSGSTAGGTAITITGTGFLEDATVNMGSPATSVVYVNDTTLTAVTPARPAGAQDVGVSQDGGTFSSSLILGFTFTSPPARGRRVRLLKPTVPWLR